MAQQTITSTRATVGELCSVTNFPPDLAELGREVAAVVRWLIQIAPTYGAVKLVKAAIRIRRSRYRWRELQHEQTEGTKWTDGQFFSDTERRDRVLLYSREELSSRLESLNEFLKKERYHLLHTGLPSNGFPDNSEIWEWLSRLYPIKPTKQSSYVRIGERHMKNSVDSLILALNIHPADVVAGLLVKNAVRLSELREKVLDLKCAVLNEAASFLRSPQPNEFFSRCLPLIRSAVTRAEADFLIQLENAYEPTGPIVVSNSDELPILHPGGLTSLVDLIAHVEKEGTIGTMHATRTALGNLSQSNGNEPLVAESIKDAIQIFLRLEEQEYMFLDQFNKTVEQAFSTELEREIVLRTTAHPRLLPCLRENVGGYAKLAKTSLEKNDKLPEWTIRGATEEQANIFRWNGRGWEVRHNCGAQRLYPDQDGFFYLHHLITRPDHGFSPVELKALKTRAAGKSASRFAVGADAVDIKLSNLHRLSDGGVVIDAEACEDYKERLEEIEEVLKTATQNESSRFENLRKEKTFILDQLKVATGLHGKLITISPEAKKARDAVRNAIDRALQNMEEVDQLLFEHLQRSLKIKDEPLFMYSPEHSTDWLTE